MFYSSLAIDCYIRESVSFIVLNRASPTFFYWLLKLDFLQFPGSTQIQSDPWNRW